MANHPDNKSFASGSHDHSIKIWDLDKCKETMHLVDHKYSLYKSKIRRMVSAIFTWRESTVIWKSRYHGTDLGLEERSGGKQAERPQRQSLWCSLQSFWQKHSFLWHRRINSDLGYPKLVETCQSYHYPRDVCLPRLVYSERWTYAGDDLGIKAVHVWWEDFLKTELRNDYEPSGLKVWGLYDELQFTAGKSFCCHGSGNHRLVRVW